MSSVTSHGSLTMPIQVHQPAPAAAHTHARPSDKSAEQPASTVPMTLCAFGITALTPEAFSPRPVLSSRDWRRWAAREGRRRLHTITIDLATRTSIADTPCSLSQQLTQRHTPDDDDAAAATQDSAVPLTEPSASSPECVQAVSLFLPQNEYLHFYRRTPADASKIPDEAPPLKAHKVDLVAFRRSTSLVEMHAQSLVSLPLTQLTDESEPMGTSRAAVHGTAQARVELRRQLVPVMLASSLLQPSISPAVDTTTEVASIAAVPADYPVIRAVPLFFNASQLSGVGFTRLTPATAGFRRTWGLKQVNTHAEARRSGSTTPPPQLSS